MRKILSIMLICMVMIAGSLTSFAAATEDAAINIMDKNICELKTNSTDLSTIMAEVKASGVNPISKAILRNEDSSVIYAADVYAVRNAAVASQNTSNQAGEGSVTFIAALDENMTLLEAGGSSSRDKWDPAGDILFTMTLTFDFSNYTDGEEFIRLTKVNGGYHIYQSGTTVSNQVINMNTTCPGYAVQNVKQYPTSSSYSYNTGFAKYVPMHHEISTVGATHDATLKRSNQTWQMYFKYNLYGN